MKNKTKLVLGLAALTAVTAGVATTSTLAWFTTTRSVSVNFSNLAVKTGNGNLEVKYVSGTNTTSTNTSYGASVTVAGSTGGTANGKDISGDGKTFYRPTWNATKLETSNSSVESAYANYYTAKSIDTVSPDGNFITFQITLHNAGSNKVDIFLNSGTKISAGADGENNTKAANGTRVAISDNENLLSMWQGGAEDSEYNYIKSADTGTYLYGVDKFTLGDVTNDFKRTVTSGLYTGIEGINAWHAGNSFNTINSAADGEGTNGRYIGRMEGSAELTLTINMWFEGTSKFIVDSLEGAVVKADINFVSVDVVTAQ